MKFIISTSFHLIKLFLCLLAILNYQNILNDSYGQIIILSLLFLGILVPVSKLFIETKETVIAPYNIDKTIEIDNSERENKDMIVVAEKPEYKTERTANGDKEVINEDVSEIGDIDIIGKSPEFSVTNPVINDQAEPMNQVKLLNVAEPKNVGNKMIAFKPKTHVTSNWIHDEKTPKAKKSKLNDLNQFTVRSYISK